MKNGCTRAACFTMLAWDGFRNIIPHTESLPSNEPVGAGGLWAKMVWQVLPLDS